MKRASYRHAIEWIAQNDEPSVDVAEIVQHFISVLLTADLFGVEQMRVARDVVRYREKNGVN